MKYNKIVLYALTFVFAFGIALQAQEAKKLTIEEWEAEMAKLKTKKEALLKEVSSLQAEVDNLRGASAKIQSYDDCVKDLYTTLGDGGKSVSSADVDNFRKAVNALEGKIRRKEGKKADLQAELDALKKNKLSALPEFFDRVHNQMQRMLNEWVEDEAKLANQDKMYTVVKGDCLWFIARKKDFYGNGFAWPKIYNANREQIKNPDLIYPKQEFRIPPLTQEEKDKYDKLKRNYKPAPAK